MPKKLTIIDIMMIIVILVVLFTMSGCGKETNTIYESCEVQGQLMLCPDGSVTELPIRDQEPAQPIDGAVKTIYDPCGDQKGHDDEIVLVMVDRTVLAWHPQYGFRTLTEGKTFTSRDKQNCYFRILNGELEHY